MAWDLMLLDFAVPKHRILQAPHSRPRALGQTQLRVREDLSVFLYFSSLCLLQ